MRIKNKLHRQGGFTLIELLIVILILGLLAGLGLASFVTVQQKSRDSRRKQDLANVAKALELYYNDFGNYPSSVDDAGTYKLQACGATAQASCSWGEVWQGEGGMIYMSELPSDPSEGLSYAYLQTGEGYYLFAHLENDNDPDVSASNYSVPNCGGVNNCNYVLRSNNVVSSPDTQ